MYVSNRIQNLNFPALEMYCLYLRETKKSAIYSKCQTHPKLLLVIQKPFLILPIGTFKTFWRRPSNFLFSPLQMHGVIGLVMILVYPFWFIIHNKTSKQLSSMLFSIPKQFCMKYVVFDRIPNNKCKTLSLLLILQVRLTSDGIRGSFICRTHAAIYSPRKQTMVHGEPNLQNKTNK